MEELVSVETSAGSFFEFCDQIYLLVVTPKCLVIVLLAMLEITLVLTMLIIASSIIAIFVFLIKGVVSGNNAHFKKAFFILLGGFVLVLLVNVINLLIPDAWRF